MAEPRRPLCAEVSTELGEPLAATASRIDRWILLEYRGLWSPDPLPGSMLPEAVKAHLVEQLDAAPRSRLLFIRRPRSEHHGIVCYTGTTPERGGRLFRLELESHDDLVGLDLFGRDRGALLGTPLLAVCTHGKRDRCCARYGRPLYDAVSDQIDPDWVWQCTHVGGDRFAGNVVCFPEGLYFGRVGLGDVWPLLDDYLAGRIYVDRYRGRCAYSFPVQAAERELRVRLGLRGVDDLRLAGSKRVDGGWRVAFDAAGRHHELEVEAVEGELAYLTCDADQPKRPRRYVVR
jgi:Sucrase/ferredoxin-like